MQFQITAVLLMALLYMEYTNKIQIHLLKEYLFISYHNVLIMIIN